MAVTAHPLGPTDLLVQGTYTLRRDLDRLSHRRVTAPRRPWPSPAPSRPAGQGPADRVPVALLAGGRAAVVTGGVSRLTGTTRSAPGGGSQSNKEDVP